MIITKINTKDSWFPSIDKAIESGCIRTFGTQRQAIEAATSVGWGKRAIKTERRFERVWIVGTIDFQPDETAGVVSDVLRVPLLKYVTGDDGVKYQPVITFKLPRSVQEFDRREREDHQHYDRVDLMCNPNRHK